MDKSISYLNKNFNDFRDALREVAKKYYPQFANDFDDASVGSWLIDVNADVADNLSYHLDRAFQETNLNTAQQLSSLYNIARSNGLKIPGPKGAMAECSFSCIIPATAGAPNSASSTRVPYWDYAPIVKRGTIVKSANQTFELMEDLDFKEQFNSNGTSNRTITPIMDSNKLITSYRISKTGVVIAGQSDIIAKEIKSSDVKPFMEVIIPQENVMNVESILIKDGTNYTVYPSVNEFMRDEESWDDTNKNNATPNTWRYFEVDSLAEQHRWGPVLGSNPYKPTTYEYGYVDENNNVIPTYSVTQGAWRPLRQKFITEFTDKGYLKVIFGAGHNSGDITTTDVTDATTFSQFQISRIMNNDTLGVLPNPGTTMFILYRWGGGRSSNVAKGAINYISLLRAEIGGESVQLDPKVVATIKSTFTVTNTTPSVSGKDMPNADEIRNMIKYNNASQNRCVTVKDYANRILMMPPKYGCPFRIGVSEENNKVMVYLLGVDYEKHLDATLPDVTVNNIKNYLSEYRSINDFVEIKSGRIINLSVEVDAFIDENYNKSDLVDTIIKTVKDYFDINTHDMGEDIYIGDLQKEISKIDGIINLIDLRIYNEFGQNYSSTQIMQATVSEDDCLVDGNSNIRNYQKDRLQVDLDESDGVLYNEGDTMMEIKYDRDVVVRIKSRK